MIRTWGKVRDFLPMAAILLLCLLIMPATQAYAGTTNGPVASATVEQQDLPQTTAVEKKAAETPKKPATPRPREKSVLDAEVLESPLAYFRDAFSSEEEESDASATSSTIVVALKALIATLLSTVI